MKAKSPNGLTSQSPGDRQPSRIHLDFSSKRRASGQRLEWWWKRGTAVCVPLALYRDMHAAMNAAFDFEAAGHAMEVQLIYPRKDLP